MSDTNLEGDVFADTLGIVLVDLHLPSTTATATNVADILVQYTPPASHIARKI